MERILKILMLVFFFVLVWASGCSNVSLGKTQVGDFGPTTDAQRIQECFINKYGDPAAYSGSPRFLEPMVSDGIVNDVPTDKVTKFSKDTQSVYIWAFYEGFKPGDEITAIWTYNGQQFASLSKQVKGNYGLLSGEFDKPGSGWAVGTHTITISGKGAESSATFEIIDGKTQTVPLPCQEVIPTTTVPVTSTTQHTWVVAAIARQIGANDAIVTWEGGQDNPMVTSYSITITNYFGSTTTKSNLPPIVGQVTTISGAASVSQDHVIVIGYFKDGSSQIVLETYI